jgi:hypothetical protein
VHLKKLHRTRGFTGKHVDVCEAETRHIGVKGCGTLDGGERRLMLAQEDQGLAKCDVSLRQLGC